MDRMDNIKITSHADTYWMHIALYEAHVAATEGEVPVGAAVVCEGNLISQAHNCREQNADPAAHAEFLAIENAAFRLGRWRLTDCTVYVTLEPCLMCAGLMVNARIGRCVFGTADPKAGALGSLYALNRDARLNHSFEVIGGINAHESAQLLHAFFQSRRKR